MNTGREIIAGVALAAAPFALSSDVGPDSPPAAVQEVELSSTTGEILLGTDSEQPSAGGVSVDLHEDEELSTFEHVKETVSDISDTVLDFNITLLQESTGFLRDNAYTGFGLVAGSLLLGSMAMNRDLKLWDSNSQTRQIWSLARRGLIRDNRDSWKKIVFGTTGLFMAANGLIAATLETDRAIVDSGQRPYLLLEAMADQDDVHSFVALPAGESQPFTEGEVPSLADIDPIEVDGKIFTWGQSFVGGEIDGDEKEQLHIVGVHSDILPGEVAEDEVIVDGNVEGDLYVGSQPFEIAGSIEGGSSLQRRFTVFDLDTFGEAFNEDPFGAFIEAETIEEAQAILVRAGVDLEQVSLWTEDEFYQAIETQFTESVSPVTAQQAGYILGFGALAVGSIFALRLEASRKTVGVLRAVGTKKSQLEQVAMVRAAAEGALSGARGLVVAVPLSKFTEAAQQGIDVSFSPTNIARNSLAATTLITTASALVGWRQARRMNKQEITDQMSD